MQVIAICNQKGGCGKTTASVNIAACLASLGKKTLLIDADYQANASSYLGMKYLAQKKGSLLSEGILEGKPLDEVIINTNIPSLDLIAADMELGRINREKILEPGAHGLLDRWLKSEKGQSYDFIIIDSHPSLDLLFQNVMVAADHYLLPLFPEPDSFDGLALMFSEIGRIQLSLNPKLRFLGSLISKARDKSSTHRRFIRKIKSFGKNNDMNVLGIIPDSDAVASSSDAQSPLIKYKPTLPVTTAYLSLTKKIIKELKHKKTKPITPNVNKQNVNTFLSDEIEINEVEVSF